MPYSFTQIEKEKTQTIFWVFLFLVGFYFVTAWLLYWVVKNYLLINIYSPVGSLWAFPSLEEDLKILAVTASVGAAHGWLSTVNLLPRMLDVLKAKTLTEKDTHHQVFQNVVDEVSVATGGKKFLARVIPCSAMNAFAIMDFQGRAVIGVTEGLLARLTRPQLEAVVGHEAAHIVSGDCLATTVVSSLFGIYDAILRGIEQMFFDDDYSSSSRVRTPRGKAGGLIFIVYGLLLITRLMSLLLRMFISREREMRADATAVRLTRDPLSLAEALYAISYRWRGGGLTADQLQAIFIVNPSFEELDESQGWWSDLFSTHPPVRHRLKVLLGMARTSLENLEAGFQKEQPRTEVPDIAKASPPRWMVSSPDGEWQGLFGVSQLAALPWFTPETWVKREGGEVVFAYMDSDLNAWFRQGKASDRGECPRCHLPLVELPYEGVPVLGCGYCRGVLTRKEDDIQTILIRRDVRIPPRVQKLAEMIEQEQKFRPRAQVSLKGLTLFDCPACFPQKNKMIRKFFNMVYPVEVDQCLNCEATWFDTDELEMLQVLVEKNTNKYYV